jgi:hypothetical protein
VVFLTGALGPDVEARSVLTSRRARAGCPIPGFTWTSRTPLPLNGAFDCCSEARTRGSRRPVTLRHGLAHPPGAFTAVPEIWSDKAVAR